MLHIDGMLFGADALEKNLYLCVAALYAVEMPYSFRRLRRLIVWESFRFVG